MDRKIVQYLIEGKGHRFIKQQLAPRKVLAHRVSISMTADFCIEALEEAIAKHGTPEIFNSDQRHSKVIREMTSRG